MAPLSGAVLIQVLLPFDKSGTEKNDAGNQEKIDKQHRKMYPCRKLFAYDGLRRIIGIYITDNASAHRVFPDDFPEFRVIIQIAGKTVITIRFILFLSVSV